MPILGGEECDALRLFADGNHQRIRVAGNDAVFDDGSWVSFDVLRYLLEVDPPLLLDAGPRLSTASALPLPAGGRWNCAKT